MTTIAFMGHSIPVFWFGLILIIIFNVTFKNPFTGGPLLPGGGMYTIGEPFSLDDWLAHLILPASVLTLHNLGNHVRYMRAGMLDVLHPGLHPHRACQRSERARGDYEARVQNAVLPLVTIIGLEIPGLFNGALLTEIIFSWPGMGRLFFNSIERADYAVMMGVLMMSASLIIVFGLVTDIVYASLDPRIRFE